MSSKSSISEDVHNAKVCVICCQNVEYFALGRCDHPVCYQCGVRIRFLCKENICAVCRTDLPELIIIKEPKPFDKINSKNLLKDRKTGIIYGSVEAQELANKLLEHKCTMCKERPPDKTFNQLRDHVKKHHNLFYCEICVDHLKLFSHEKKVYNRKQLATHRRTGDPDDKSHKGHPQCEFCDIRFLDNDELMLHLRKNHLWCHFCEKDGIQDYYSDYSTLREHFRNSHFLCDEGECEYEKFTSVFRTQIDYQAHKASRHSKNMSKAVARQNRQLDLQFNYARRPGNQMNSNSREFRGPPRREPRGQNRESGRVATGGPNGSMLARDAENIEIAIAQSLTLSTSERNKGPDSKQKRAKKTKPPNNKGADINKKEKENNIDLSQPRREASTSVPDPVEKETSVGDVLMADKTPISSQKIEGDFQNLSADSNQAVHSVGPGKLVKMSLVQEADFPSLTKDVKQPKQNGIVSTAAYKMANKTLKRTEEDFPSLSGERQAHSASGSSGKKFSKALKLAEEECPSLKVQQTPSVQSTGASRKVFNLHDFPTLSATPSSTFRPAPPPGFSNSRPPPGLVPQTKPPGPPPGLQMEAAAPMKNQNNTAPIMPLEPPGYSLPNNYQERNKALINTIQELLGKDKFMQFKSLSGEFRQGHGSASKYYDNCCELFGANMQKIFHELVALLPDPVKQQELLTAHNDAKALAKQKGQKVLKISTMNADTAIPWQKVENFNSCPYCQQFLRRKDWDSHLAGHSADQEFPSLSAAHSVRAPPGMKPGANTKIAWVKGK